MSPVRLKAALLDMDGTMVDAFPPIVEALNRTLREFGRPEMTPLEIRRHTGRGGNGGIRPLFGDDAEAAGRRFLELHDAIYLEQIEPMPGAETLLELLHDAGLGAAIVTSKGQQRAEAQLEALGWRELVPVVVGKLDGRAEKPDPEPLQIACRALAVTPAETVMIGDGTADMTAAVRAGSLGIALPGAFSEKELRDAGAAYCFATLDEVSRWLQQKIS